MTTNRSRIHHLFSYLLLGSGACALCSAAQAEPQGYPNRPVTVITFTNPGGAVDNVVRVWAACAERLTGQPFVIMPKPGGNGVVTGQAFRKVTPDGYTLMATGLSQTAIAPFTHKKPPFDPEKEFQPAAMFASTPFVLVASVQSGIKNMKELKAFAASTPNGLDLGIAGVATVPHLLSAALSDKMDLKATFVPLNGETGGVTALLGGQVPVMLMVAGTAIPHIQSGKLVPLMTFSDKRLAQLPQIPTVVEELKDPSMVRAGWVGITTRTGTPAAIVQTVDGWTSSCVGTPEFRKALDNALFTTDYLSHDKFTEQVRDDIRFWRPWIAKLNISNE